MKLFLAFTLSLGLLSPLAAKEAAPPAPVQLCGQLTKALPAAEQGSVSFSGLGGNAAATVISPDGYVLTAGHVGDMMKNKEDVKIIYLDGTEATVKLLGSNVETDTALLKIISPERKDWPHVKLATTADTTGGFCFTTSSKFGYSDGKKPIVRIGRIVSHSMLRDKPGLLISDMDIQPGDSGGGLFNLKGELIGINSSAAGLVGMNIYPAIDQFYLDKQRLEKGEIWGNKELSPIEANNYKLSATQEVLESIQAELTRRLQLNYPPSLEFIQQHIGEGNQANITAQDLINHMQRDSIMLGLGQPLSIGMDDPHLTKQLPDLPTEHTAPLNIMSGDEKIALALALDNKHLIVKLSLLAEKEHLTLSHREKNTAVRIVAKDEARDLALLKLKQAAELPLIQWPEENPMPAVGDFILAANAKGWKLWGNISTASMPIEKNTAVGPIDDKGLISKHRSPFPYVYICSIPLYAADAGTPVFDKDNNLIGIYIARYTRTMGLILPTSQLKLSTEKLLKEASKPKEVKSITIQRPLDPLEKEEVQNTSR